MTPSGLNACVCLASLIAGDSAFELNFTDAADGELAVFELRCGLEQWRVETTSGGGLPATRGRLIVAMVRHLARALTLRDGATASPRDAAPPPT